MTWLGGLRRTERKLFALWLLSKTFNATRFMASGNLSRCDMSSLDVGLEELMMNIAWCMK
jgi:hypothetical protein